MCVFLLVSCGSEKTPSDETIQADISASLQEYNPVFTFTGFTTEKSLSDEGHYSATLNVEAASKYADYQLSCDINYTKYDQGWIMDSSSWSVSGYEVARYPSQEELEPLILEADSRFYNYFFVDLLCEGDTVTYLAERAPTEQEYISFSDIREGMQCQYDPESDSWLPSNHAETSANFTLKDTLEGTWYDSWSGTFVVSNLTDTGFDLSLDSSRLSFDATYIDLSEASRSPSGYTLLHYKGSVDCEIEEDGVWHADTADITIDIANDYFGGFPRFYITILCQTAPLAWIDVGGSLEKI